MSPEQPPAAPPTPQPEERRVTRGEALGLVERTRKNLAFIEEAARRGEDVHIVTQLVNSLLGLVVFPWEHRDLSPNLLNVPLAQLAEQGWPDWHVAPRGGQTLKTLVHRLRNAIAYGRLVFSSDSRIPGQVTIFITDCNPQSKQVVWSAYIQADQLLGFCNRFVQRVEDRLG